MKEVITSSDKRNEAVRWRSKAVAGKISQFFKSRYIRVKKRINRSAAREEMIVKLQERLKEQVEASAKQNKNLQTQLKLQNKNLQTQLKLQNQNAQEQLKSQNANALELQTSQLKKLQERLKTVTKDYNDQQLETGEVRKELNVVTNLVKGDALEQLKVTNRLLKTKTAKLNEIEQQLSTVSAFIEYRQADTEVEFSIDNFITKTLASGYHKQGRYFLLDELHQHDWEALLAFFANADDGFDALEKLRPLFTPWIQNYHALIDVIEDRGFHIRPIDDYIDNGMQDKTVYIYHDVHAWDIIPALGMVLANKDRGICTTFCLNIDQAHVDIAHEAGYRIFGTLFGDNAKVGLHCNPFASWIRMDLFGKDEQKFMKWFDTGKAEDQLKALLAGNTKKSGIFKKHTRDTAEAATYERLNKNFQKLKSFCPEARVANHHGDIVNQLYKDIRIKHSQTDSFLFVSSMLREERAEDLGVLTSPTAIRRQNKPIGLIYGEIQNQSHYFENLHAELDEGVSRQLINHPGAISNGGLVMNLDFVRKLSTGSFEDYPPMEAKKSTKKTPLSETIVQIDEDD